MWLLQVISTEVNRWVTLGCNPYWWAASSGSKIDNKVKKLMKSSLQSVKNMSVFDFLLSYSAALPKEVCVTWNYHSFHVSLERFVSCKCPKCKGTQIVSLQKDTGGFKWLKRGGCWVFCCCTKTTNTETHLHQHQHTHTHTSQWTHNSCLHNPPAFRQPQPHLGSNRERRRAGWQGAVKDKPVYSNIVGEVVDILIINNEQSQQWEELW